MSRRQNPSELAALADKLAEIAPAVKEARDKARQHLPPYQRPDMPTLSAETPNLPARIAAAVHAFGAPAALAGEMSARGLTLRQTHDLLSCAAGSARTVTAAGVESIRLHLLAMDETARNAAARADADRTVAVADLLHRYNLVHTMAGARVAASKHDAATLRTLVQNRADAFGRISPCNQVALMRDLQFTLLKDTTQ